MRGERAERALLVCATLLLKASLASSPCARGATWWDARAAVCRACTVCDAARRFAVLRPCELHRDALCVPLHRLDIPWPSRRRPAPPLAEDEREAAPSVAAAVPAWDGRAAALALAASGCVIFFVVVICLPLYHTRQWRRLKQTLERDVHDMTAKLRLMECGPVGAEEAAGGDRPPTLPAHHVYSNIPHSASTAGKDPFLGEISRKGLNNVYTQEKQPT